MDRIRRTRTAATPPGDHPGWPGTPPNLADADGWVNDEALGVARRMVGDGTLHIHSLGEAGSNRIVDALKALYGRRWGETERLEDCGDGRLVWVVEDEDQPAFEQALSPGAAGQRAGGERMSRARRTASRIARIAAKTEPADPAGDAEYARRQEEAKADDAQGEPSMRTFSIDVSGATLDDVLMAIDEAKRVIGEGNTSGFNDNETGSFSFDSSGEYADRGNEGTCPSCDADLPSGAVECPECGSAVDNPGSEEWGGRECYACSARLYGDAMTCPDCGAKQKPLPGGAPGSP